MPRRPKGCRAFTNGFESDLLGGQHAIRENLENDSIALSRVSVQKIKKIIFLGHMILCQRSTIRKKEKNINYSTLPFSAESDLHLM